MTETYVAGTLVIMILRLLLALTPERVKKHLIQTGYDYGFDRGYANGKLDKEHEIVNLIESKTEVLDWLDDSTVEARHIVPMIKSATPTKVDEWSREYVEQSL